MYTDNRTNIIVNTALVGVDGLLLYFGEKTGAQEARFLKLLVQLVCVQATHSSLNIKYILHNLDFVVKN